MREDPEYVVVENGGQETTEGDVKRYFGGGKGAALEIWQAWRGGRSQGSIGVRVLFRER